MDRNYIREINLILSRRNKTYSDTRNYMSILRDFTSEVFVTLSLIVEKKESMQIYLNPRLAVTLAHIEKFRGEDPSGYLKLQTDLPEDRILAISQRLIDNYDYPSDYQINYLYFQELYSNFLANLTIISSRTCKMRGRSARLGDQDILKALRDSIENIIDLRDWKSTRPDYRNDLYQLRY